MTTKPLLTREGFSAAEKDIGSEDEFARFLSALFREAREAQKPLAEKWARCDRFYRGRQWERNLEAWRAQVVKNTCFQLVEAQLPTLATAEARMSVVPVEGGDKATADALDDLMNYLNWRHSWFNNTIMAQKIAIKYGGCLLKTGWDKSLGLLGDVSYSRVSPFLFFPDPDALELSECNFVFEAKALTLSEIRHLHGKKGKLVRPDLSVFDPAKTKEGDFPLVPPHNLGPGRDEPLFTGEARRMWRDYTQRALYVECWLKDYTTVKQGGKEVLAYPGGRHVIFAGGVVLVDEPNPFWHRQFPYVMLPDYPDDQNFWPIGDLELIIILQQLQNKSLSQVVDNMTIFGNPVWIVDDQSGVRADTIDNSPNAVIRKRQGTEVRRDDPPNLPPYIVDAVERVEKSIEDITGLNDVVQGRRPEGVRGYSAIRLLLEMAETRLRLKIIWQQDALRRCARQLVSDIMQYYTPERYERILGEKRVKEMIASRLAQGLNKNESGKKVMDRLVFTLEEAYDSYDYATESEVLTHNTRQLLKDMARDLYAIQAIDREALLKTLGVPGWEEIIERMEGRKPGEGMPEPARVPPAGPPPPRAAIPGPGGEAPPPIPSPIEKPNITDLMGLMSGGGQT